MRPLRKSERSSFMRAAFAGSLLALILDVLMLSDGHPNLWHQMGLLGSFYDLQGHALLHGHLSLPPGSASFEGFMIGGHTYVYFGPVPALLRFPVLLFTHALDGRLTQLSMLLAFIVLLVAGARVHWRVRQLLRPAAPVCAAERAAAFLLAFSLGAGGVPLFLASWPVVYHEAELWGAALSLAAVAAILRIIVAPTGRRIAWAGLLALLAAGTRISVALGPIIALALLALALAAGIAAEGWAERGGVLRRTLQAIATLGPSRPERRGRVAAFLALAATVALGSAIAINEAKFHSAFGVPLQEQIDTSIDPIQRAFVAAYHGSAFGARFVPTTLLAAIRPDAIGTVRAFPFIGLPSSAPTVIGSVRFNALLPSLSAFTSMPLFCILLLAGAVGVVRSRLSRPLLGLLIATAAAFVPALTFGSTATRYLADLLPFLFLGACAGLQPLWKSRRLRARPGRGALLGAIAVLAIFGLLINASVGLVQQRLVASTTSAATRASFVRAQDNIDRFLGRAPHGIHTGDALPTRAIGSAGDLFILGRCDGLYAEGFPGIGGNWLPVERTGRSGLYELLVRFPGAPTGPMALLTLGRGGRRVTVVAREAAAGRIAFSVRVGGLPVTSGAPVSLAPRGATEVTVSIDPLGSAWFLSLRLRGTTAVDAPVPYDRLASEVLGADPDAPALARFGGTIARLPERTPVCDQIVRRARLRLPG